LLAQTMRSHGLLPELTQANPSASPKLVSDVSFVNARKAL
jgi:hypothetical protein